MKIKSVDFAGAIGQIGQAQPESTKGLSQIAFAGRSNVGKSSLINRVLGRTRTPIARVSQQPGKTQEINFYQVRAEPRDFGLVDLPGYGYARVPGALRDKWRPLIHGFLAASEELSGVVQLIDVRHGPTDDDLQAVDYLAEVGVPALFVFTKLDKLKPSQRPAAIRKSADMLGVDIEQVIAVSAHSGEGIEDLLDTIGALLFAGAETEEGERSVEL
jgi:GTP-binding protein